MSLKEWIMNLWPVQNFRDKRAASILKILEENGVVEMFKGDIFTRRIDLGSGQGEIPKAVAEIAGYFTCLEKYSDPSEKVKKALGERLSWHKVDAIKYLQITSECSVDAITAFYFLQVLLPDEQARLLWQIKRVVKPGGIVVFIEEYKRGWPGRWIDIAMNKFLNVLNEQGYEIYSEKTWDDIFEIARGFPRSKISYKFGRNSKLFVFQF